MNYRHAYHAGNAADVFKHVTLIECLLALHKKPTPLCVIDTHAGRGEYSLEPGGEWESGINTLWRERAAWPQLRTYLDLVGEHNGSGPLVRYPGSPWLIAKLLRPNDRGILSELHPEDYAALKAGFGQYPNMHVHHTDAWLALKAFLPPKENRGLVLIDPPYERTDEFTTLAQALTRALKHWRNGVYLAWYPIKVGHRIELLHRAVAAAAPRAFAVEFLTLAEDVPKRLNGSGMVVVNGPWGVRERLAELLPPLAQALAGSNGEPQVRFQPLAAD